jgi:hypothetical protein
LQRRTQLTRGSGPTRRAPLPRGTGLCAAGRLTRHAQLQATRHPVGDDPTRFPAAVTDAALERSGGACERCGRWVGDGGWAPHHRRPKGAGGTVLPDTHTLPNCLVACHPCHAWIHAHPAASEDAGWLVRHPGDPAATEVLVRVGSRQVRMLLAAEEAP